MTHQCLEPELFWIVMASIGGLAVALPSGLGLGWAIIKWTDHMDRKH